MASRIEIGTVGEVGGKESLLKRGAVEDLTRQGRVVDIWSTEIGRRESSDYRRAAFVFVPPPGISFGDKVHQSLGGGLEFFRGRTSLGHAELIEVNRDEADAIRKRRNRILGLIGRSEDPVYEGISDKEHATLAPSRYEPRRTLEVLSRNR